MKLRGFLNEPLLLSLLLDAEILDSVRETLLYYNRHRSGPNYKDIIRDEYVLRQVLCDIKISLDIRDRVEEACIEYFRQFQIQNLQNQNEQ
jgi:hypothetical protein